MFASHRTVSAPDKSWKKKAFIKSKLNMLKTDRSVKDEEDNSKEISNISLNLNEVEGMLFIEAKNNKCEPNTDSALSSNDSDNRELPSTGSNLHESSSKSTLPHYESLIEMFIVDEPPKFEVVTGEKLHFELVSFKHPFSNVNLFQGTILFEIKY